jgi:hypothetical protein
VKSNLVTDTLSVTSGLRLGQAPSQVMAILGKPNVFVGNKMVHSCEVQKKTSPKDLDELRGALAEFPERYNQRWIVQRLPHPRPSSSTAPCACRVRCSANMERKSRRSEGYAKRSASLTEKDSFSGHYYVSLSRDLGRLLSSFPRIPITGSLSGLRYPDRRAQRTAYVTPVVRRAAGVQQSAGRSGGCLDARPL